MFEHITASEIVGTLLLCDSISAPKIDPLISASQRSSLGICKGYGDLRMIAYSRCNGLGLAKEGGPFAIIPVNDQYQSFGGGSKPRSIACTNCQSKRRFDYPECSKLTPY